MKLHMFILFSLSGCQMKGTECSADVDSDGDGIDDCTEYDFGTDRTMADSDDDCQFKCGCAADCLGYVDMSANGWGYYLKNYVGPNCVERRSGSVLRIRI